MPHDRRGVPRGLLARVPYHRNPESGLQSVRLVALRIVLLQPRRVRQQGEPRLAAAAAFASLSSFSEGLGRGCERLRGLLGQLERVRGRQRVVLVEDCSLEARCSQGPPVQRGDVPDGEVREEERGRGGGLVFFFCFLKRSKKVEVLSFFFFFDVTDCNFFFQFKS